MSELGMDYFGYWTPPYTPKQITVYVHYGTDWNNAKALPTASPPQLRFGDGDGTDRLDFSKDDTVIYHEYMHMATSEMTSPATLLTTPPSHELAINEAISDFMACSFVDDYKFEPYAYNEEAGPLRDLDYDWVLSDWGQGGDLDPDSAHEGSQVLSSALWDCREELGIYEEPRWRAEVALFNALWYLDDDITFEDVRDAFMAGAWLLAEADFEDLYAIREIFADHEIGTLLETPSIMSAECVEDGEDLYVELEWTRNDYSQLVSQYDVWRSIEGDTWEHLAYVSQPEYDGEEPTPWLVEYTDDGRDWENEEPLAEYIEYKVRAYSDEGGWTSFSNTAYVEIDGGPEESSTYGNEDSAPEKLTLGSNYPNPFNPSTSIRFGLTEPGIVKLQVLNIRGQLVRNLVDGDMTAGWHTVTWDGRNDAMREVASGIYLYVLEAEGKRLLKRMLLVR